MKMKKNYVQSPPYISTGDPGSFAILRTLKSEIKEKGISPCEDEMPFVRIRWETTESY